MRRSFVRIVLIAAGRRAGVGVVWLRLLASGVDAADCLWRGHCWISSCSFLRCRLRLQPSGLLVWQVGGGFEGGSGSQLQFQSLWSFSELPYYMMYCILSTCPQEKRNERLRRGPYIIHGTTTGIEWTHLCVSMLIRLKSLLNGLNFTRSKGRCSLVAYIIGQKANLPI